ncbi:MAG: DUF983 domain-containing protein [Bacteroidia bacterium]
MCDKYEPSKLLSVLKSKCPQCQSGKMFKYGAFDLKRFSQMHTNCPVCNLKFEIEPGFFWGAMYVSYAFSVSIMITIGGTILILSHGEADFWTYVIPIISAFLILSPVTYRMARVFMIHFFSPVRFKPNLANKK